MLSPFLVEAVRAIENKIICYYLGDCKTYSCSISVYATDSDDVPKSIAAIHLLSCSTGVALSIFSALDSGGSGPLDKAMNDRYIREVSMR